MLHFNLHNALYISDTHQLDLALTLGFTDNQLWLTTPKHQACLIGPASFDLDINAAVYKTHPPTSSVMLSAGVIPIRLGNESISLSEQSVKEVLALLPQKVSPITLVSFSLITLAFISTKNTFMIICFSIKNGSRIITFLLAVSQ